MAKLSQLWRKICSVPLPLAIIIAALLIALAILIKPNKMKVQHYKDKTSDNPILQKYGIRD